MYVICYVQISVSYRGHFTLPVLSLISFVLIADFSVGPFAVILELSPDANGIKATRAWGVGGVTSPPPPLTRYMAFFSAYEAATAINPRMIDAFDARVGLMGVKPRQLGSFSRVAVFHLPRQKL